MKILSAIKLITLLLTVGIGIYLYDSYNYIGKHITLMSPPANSPIQVISANLYLVFLGLIVLLILFVIDTAIRKYVLR